MWKPPTHCLLLVLLSALQPTGALVALPRLLLLFMSAPSILTVGFFLGGMTNTEAEAISSSSQVCHLSCHQPYSGSLCPCQICPTGPLRVSVFLSMMWSERGRKEILFIFYISGGPEGWSTAREGGGGTSFISTPSLFSKTVLPYCSLFNIPCPGELETMTVFRGPHKANLSGSYLSVGLLSSCRECLTFKC